MNELARKLAITIAAATAVVVIGWLVMDVDSAHNQLADVRQSHNATATKLAAIEPRALVRVLPLDAENCHTSLYIHGDWQRRPLDRKLAAWWKHDPGLRSVHGQTHSHIYTAKHRLFRERYSKTVPVLPAVRVQQPDGKVLYQVSGKAIPSTSSQLAGEMAECFRDRKKRRNPEPAPEPDVDVDVDVTPAPVIPDVIPDVPATSFPWLLLVVVVILAGIVPVIVHFKNAFRG